MLVSHEPWTAGSVGCNSLPATITCAASALATASDRRRQEDADEAHAAVLAGPHAHVHAMVLGFASGEVGRDDHAAVLGGDQHLAEGGLRGRADQTRDARARDHLDLLDGRTVHG